MKTTVRLIVSGILIALSVSASAQDTLRLSNGDLLHGEIKSLNKSVVTIETGYSDDDFKVEWEGVVEISSPRKFTLFLSSKERVFASLRPGEEPGQLTLILDDGTRRLVSLKHIVIIDPIKVSFKNRFNASISSGLSIAKANNSKQFSTRATAS